MKSGMDQPVQQASVIDSYPLSATQSGMLFQALRHPPGEGVDIQQIGMTVLTPLDPGLFVYAWYQVMERHAVLRTRLRWEGLKGEPVQEVLDAVELPVVRMDWRGLPAEALRERLLAKACQERAEGFNLAKAPLMRLFMARVGDSAWSVLWTFHHAILDGRSFPLVLREVFDIHDGLRGRIEPSLPLPMPFKRALELSAQGDAESAEHYWRQTLAGAEATPLGLELPPGLAARGPKDQPFGARQQTLSAQVSRALVQRAQAADLSLATLLYAAWALMLHRCSGKADVVFGTTRSTRHALPGDPASWVGPLIVTIPMRLSVDRNQTVDDWLAEIRARQRAARPHESLPLNRIQACAGAGPDKPLFETLVVVDHLSLPARMRQLGPVWAHRHFEYVGQTGYPLTLVAYGDELVPLRLEYDRRRFSDATAERLLGHLCTVLKSLADDLVERVGQLSWLSDAEYQALLGPTPAKFPPVRALHRHFEQQVRRTPLAPAVSVVDASGRREDVGYARLNAQANRLARKLQARGVGAGHRVGLRAERNLDLVLGVLAILKAGGAYLPLDPVYPSERAEFMLADAGVRVMLISAGLGDNWRPEGIEQVVIEKGQAQGGADALLSWDDSETDLDGVAQPSDPAYVIYTSGSTGQPKGVVVTHHNVERLFASTRSAFDFDERDVWTLFHSYSFDFSVWELWGALLHGGRLVLVSQDLSRDAEAFFDLVLRERVTVLNQTPSAFRQLVDVARNRPPASLSLRYVIFGGEALELQMLRPWFERYGDTRPQLVNMYGITETTVHVTRRVLRRQDLDEGLGSVIGEPLSDLRLLLLDNQGEPVPQGAPGELVVGGDGLSPGYLNRPELTAARFVRDNFSDEPGARLYRSGDLARWLDNGELEYLGRIDQQVKIRGFRIELGEIEAQIVRAPWVRQTAVVVREDHPGDRRLVAYVVSSGGERGLLSPARSADLRDLLQQLRQALPEYMVPAHVIAVAALPLTANGKLDAQALPSVPRDVEVTASPAIREAVLTPTQTQLLPIWTSVLRREGIGLREHFFELGGDSILSIQVVARCRALGWRISLKDLFECPTVERLAARIDERASAAPVSAQAAASDPATTPPPDPRSDGRGAAPVAVDVAPSRSSDRETAQPLSQPELGPIHRWFFEQNFAEAHHWNQAVFFELFEGVTQDQLQSAVTELMTRHPVLRQRFERDHQGRVSVRTDPFGDRERVVRVDLRGMATPAAQALMTERSVEAQSGLDPVHGPLLRAVHFVLDSGPARLLLVIHHLVVDGVSWRVLREDLEALIEAKRSGRVLPLAGPTTGVAEWHQALARYATRSDVLSTVPAWAALADEPIRTLPVPSRLVDDRGSTAEQQLRLGSVSTQILLRDVGKQFGVSVNAVLLSALLRALAKLSGFARWRIDMEGHGREPIDDQIDLTRTVGWLTSLFPVCLSLPRESPEAGPQESVRLVHDQLQQVHERGLSFGVLRWMGPTQVQQALAAVPAASILFNYLGQWDALVSGSTLFRLAEEDSGPARSAAAHRSHALELVVRVRHGLLELTASHDALQVDPSWVHGLLTAWALSLQDLISTVMRDEVRPAQTPPESPGSERMVAVPQPTGSEAAPLLGGTSNAGQAREQTTEVPHSGEAQAFALTPIQQLFFVMDQVRPELGLQQWQFVLNGPLNPVRLRRALARVVERHEILRCAFWEDESHQALQQPGGNCEAPWTDEDWRGLSGAEPAIRMRQRLADDQRQGFDLRQPPLMRVRLVRLADTTWHLIWTTHHLTLDGWSWPLVMGEWSREYAALEGGWAAHEPDPLPYRRYVEWREANGADHTVFWRGLLSGFLTPTPVVGKLPTAQESPAVEYILEMQEAQCLRLAALARRWRVTVSTLAHAAWAVSLAHANGVDAVLFGTTLAGRPPELPGVESLVGPCINNLPVPVRLDARRSLEAFLGDLQEQQAALADHQYTRLESIQQASAMAWRHRLFDSLLVFQNNQTDPDVARIGAHVHSTLIAVPEATNVPLTLTITPASGWRLRIMAARGSGLVEQDLRRWVEDLMAAWAGLDALGLQDESGNTVHLADWLVRMPASSARRIQPVIQEPLQPSAGFHLPVGNLETELLAIWRELLQTDDVPLTTNYFDMGVHSVLLLRAHRLINERLKLKLPLLALLEHSNIRALAQHVAGLSAHAPSDLAQAALARARKLHQVRRKAHARSTPASEP